MKFRVKGNIRDMIAFLRLLPKRKKIIASAPAAPAKPGAVNLLASSLHPEVQYLRVMEVRDETPTTRTFRLGPEPGSPTKTVAYFRAGQYLSVRARVGDSAVSRPYSISSSPGEALKGNYYEITVRRKEGGFFTGHIWETWRQGTSVKTSGPEGFFYIDPIRDSREILALGGGCGVTPFRSMMRDLLERGNADRFTLLYGIASPAEIVYRDELSRMEKESAGRITVHCICSEGDASWKGETGFLSATTIKKLAGGVEGKSLFVCGPPAMYRFLEGELAGLSVPRRRIRREACGESTDVTALPGYPKGAENRACRLTVQIGPSRREIPANTGETLLAAMERAGIEAPSRCRSGECGFCRSLLVRGDVFVVPDSDGRRAADRDYGFVHPCATYPLGDAEIRVPRGD